MLQVMRNCQVLLFVEKNAAELQYLVQTKDEEKMSDSCLKLPVTADPQ